MSTKNIYFIVKLLAELLGTALLLFLGCMGCLTWSREYNHLQSNLTFGLVVMIIVQIFGCVSGAHLNPSVTIAAAVYKSISIKMAFAYVFAQCIGAYLGFGLLKYLTPVHVFQPDNSTEIGLCSTVPSADLQPLQAFAIEFLATSVLVLINCGSWNPRNALLQDSFPLKLGFAVATLGCVAGPYTGASMNLARTIGPAIWNNNYHMIWIYCTAPIASGLITSFVYRYVFHLEDTLNDEIVQSVKKCSLKRCQDV